MEKLNFQNLMDKVGISTVSSIYPSREEIKGKFNRELLVTFLQNGAKSTVQRFGRNEPKLKYYERTNNSLTVRHPVCEGCLYGFSSHLGEYFPNILSGNLEDFDLEFNSMVEIKAHRGSNPGRISVQWVIDEIIFYLPKK